MYLRQINCLKIRSVTCTMQQTKGKANLKNKTKQNMGESKLEHRFDVLCYGVAENVALWIKLCSTPSQSVLVLVIDWNAETIEIVVLCRLNCLLTLPKTYMETYFCLFIYFFILPLLVWSGRNKYQYGTFQNLNSYTHLYMGPISSISTLVNNTRWMIGANKKGIISITMELGKLLDNLMHSIFWVPQIIQWEERSWY